MQNGSQRRLRASRRFCVFPPSTPTCLSKNAQSSVHRKENAMTAAAAWRRAPFMVKAQQEYSGEETPTMPQRGKEKNRPD